MPPLNRLYFLFQYVFCTFYYLKEYFDLQILETVTNLPVKYSKNIQICDFETYSITQYVQMKVITSINFKIEMYKHYSKVKSFTVDMN